jgi:prophage antirepressor-like protein
MLYDETPDTDTIFINQYAILDLIPESKIPLARQFRKWFISDVLPSILDTRSHTNKIPYLRINNEVYYCAKL